MLALLGWHTSDNRELFSMDELIQLFSIEKISKNGAKFDPEKAKWFNHQHLMMKDPKVIAQEIAPSIAEKGFTATDDYLTQVVQMVREKVNFKHEIAEKSAYFFQMPSHYDEQAVQKKWTAQASDFLKTFAEALKAHIQSDAVTIEAMFKQMATEAQISPGALMQPLRLCLSGEAGGPPLFELLVVLGVEQSIQRIQQSIDTLSKNIH